MRVSHPDKVVFPQAGITKLDIVTYYQAVADGALRGAGGRPMVLKRFVKGIDAGAVLPEARRRDHPAYIDTATLRYARARRRRRRWCGRRRPRLGRRTSAASTSTRTPCAPKTWTTRTSCASTSTRCPASSGRRSSMSHSSRGRCSPTTGSSAGRRRADPEASTSSSRIAPERDFAAVRLAAETVAREVENRAPGLATARWWKEERGESVFVDFNQNAKDRTVASAYSIRPLPDARVSTPLGWDELRLRRPEEFTVPTVLDAYAEHRRSARRDRRRGRHRWPGCSRSPTSSGRPEKPPRGADGTRAAGVSTMPLIEIARTKTKPEALAALEHWRARAPGRRGAPPAGGRPGRRHARLQLALVPGAGEPAARPRGRPARPGAR